MNNLQAVQIIGDALTQIDVVLANPNLSSSDPQFQALFAIRKHLDDQQRQLVTADIDDTAQAFTSATAQLNAADNTLKGIGTDISKVASIIKVASTIAAIADSVLNVAK
jgi:predicted small secreted protein